jgi:DNA repair protein SbcC/Rad50
MRICQIRFKNLNSLVGEWAIDLTHPAFSSDGIFAITGPTGAGKTTLLDAICLALYGRTPRLGKVTKSSNEVMSRQTGECFAEVTFESQAGRFRCHWSQHRARRKPGGELQTPKHEISDAVSGKIFETKLRGVAEEIDAATGMDFERFTRSMLLAQGDFAAFLQAPPDERAPILEQITGTEIYSRISVRVHEKYAGERKKLDTLQVELAGIALFSEEEAQLLKSILEQKMLREADLEKELGQTNDAISWREGIGLLENDLVFLTKENRDLASQKDAFKPEIHRLERAKQALELSGDHSGLVSLRSAQEADHLGVSQCRHNLPGVEAVVKQAEEASRLSTEHLAKKRADQNETLVTIRKARELDLLLKEKEAPIAAARQTVTRMEKDLEEIRLKQAADSRALDTSRNHLDTVQKFLSKNGLDAKLVEALAGIRGRFDALRDSDERLCKKNEELSDCEKQQNETHRLWEKRVATLERLKKELAGIEGAFTDRQRFLAEILAGREIPDWRNGLLELTGRKTLLEKVAEAVGSRANDQRLHGEFKIIQAALLTEREMLARSITEEMQQQSVLERELPLLETQLSLLRKIQGFEAARHQLQDGEPCPLCGAKAHPYAEGNLPVPDETMSRLNRVRATLKKSGKTLSDLLVRDAKTLKDLEQTDVRQKECSEKIAAADVFITKGLASLALDLADRDLTERISRAQEEIDTDLKKTSSVVQLAEKIEREITIMRGSLEKMRISLAQSEQDTQAAAHHKESAQQTFERVKRDVSNFAEHRRKVLEESLREVSPYGIDGLSADLLNKVFQELTDRRDRWQDQQKRKADLEKDVSTLALQTEHRQGEIIKLEIALKEKRGVFDTLIHEAEVMSRDREQLFGKKNPDTEEKRLAAAIAEAEKQLDHAHREMTDAKQEFGTLKRQIDALEKAIEIRSVQLKKIEAAFLTRAAGSGFSGEADYLAACLTEDERAVLTQKAETLTAALTGLVARHRDKTNQLETALKKRITEKSLETLKLEAVTLQASIKALRQEIGGIQQQLSDNDSRRDKHRNWANEIEMQKRECSRWESLHALIGSADGKKFRNYAQGLTFEIMVGHANRRLRQMTDRYLLVRDETQPLELNVIDNYQAGEIRSTKNLSGGESFIVSLSLALGLSVMASKNVRVDSLFLDEGFGTLDEEALDTALETLGGLQQDGKLIGVISHVPALKERIGTRIQLIPQTGGRSVISGPGCGRTEEVKGE